MKMKKTLLSLLCVAMATLLHATTPGTACENAIYVDSTFSQNIEPNRTYWYTANSEDLPLIVYFFPNEESENDPQVYVDLTCTPGVYSDPNVASMVADLANYEAYFPAEMDLEVVMVEGKKTYKLHYERDILDAFAAFNIDYSIPAYVSLRTDVAGTAQIDNYKVIQNCEELSIRADMQDTLNLLANDTSRTYYFPVTEWVGSKLRFTWTGQTPLLAYLDNTCVIDTANAYDRYTFSSNNNGLHAQALSDVQINQYVRYTEDGNMYVKFYAQEDGKLYVDDYKEHGVVTINTCAMNYKTTAITFPTSEAGLALTKNVTSASKSFRFKADDVKDKNIRLKWQSANHEDATAIFAKFCGFEFTPKDPDVIDTVHFYYNEQDGYMYADLLKERVNDIAAKHTDGWVFLQINRIEEGTLWWDEFTPPVIDCNTKSTLLAINDTIDMPAYNQNTIYRLNVDEWKDSIHCLVWEGSKQAYIFIADTCEFSLAANNMHVGLYKQVGSNDSTIIDKDKINDLILNRADGLGNIYLRLRSAAKGKLITKTMSEIPGTTTDLKPIEATWENRTTKLILIDNHIYIQVIEQDHTYLYDLMGNKIQ